MTEKSILFIGSHLGYPMDKTPLGGGAMVGLHLAKHWARAGKARLTVIGSGPEAPSPDIAYLQLPSGSGTPDLTRMSEWEYARFCRTFEAAVTRHVADRNPPVDPRKTAFVVNDLSESPDLATLSGLGAPVVSIWHVDVVDFFNRIYLGGIVSPDRLTKAWDWFERRRMAGLFPDVIRLVFQKQRTAVLNADLLVVPSRRMAETIRRCYPGPFPKSASGNPSIRVLPWGGWDGAFPENEVESGTERTRLAEHYRIRPETRVLMTLSRISPEKGLHHLLEALRILESDGSRPSADLCVLICGEPAFMRGPSYLRKVQRAAARLRRTRVFFPGYLSAFAKKAHFRLADLFVSPSVHESYGLTLVEAMREGLPVLASDHYGVEEIVSPSWGRVVSFRTPGRRSAHLASGLRELLSDPSELKAMGERAGAAAREMRFDRSAETLLDDVLDLIG